MSITENPLGLVNESNRSLRVDIAARDSVEIRLKGPDLEDGEKWMIVIFPLANRPAPDAWLEFKDDPHPIVQHYSRSSNVILAEQFGDRWLTTESIETKSQE